MQAPVTELAFVPETHTAGDMQIPLEASPESVARFEQLLAGSAAGETTTQAPEAAAPARFNGSLDSLGETVINYTERVSDRWQSTMQAVVPDLLNGNTENAVSDSMRALVYVTFAQIDVQTATSCGRSVESSVEQLMRNA